MKRAFCVLLFIGISGASVNASDFETQRKARDIERAKYWKEIVSANSENQDIQQRQQAFVTVPRASTAAIPTPKALLPGRPSFR